MLSATDTSLQGGRGFTLDISLERVFGSGATQLAIGFEDRIPDEDIHNISDSSSTRGSVPLTASSTPGRDISKKRLRSTLDTSLGDLSSITGREGVQEGIFAGEESDEGVDGESKKQRLGVGLDSNQGSTDEDSNEGVSDEESDKGGSEEG